MSIAGPQASDTWNYTYDSLDRLLSASNINTPLLSKTFAYNSAHSIASNSSLGNYAYPAQGPPAIRPHALLQAGPYTLSYDNNGNRVTKTDGTITQTIAWDGENRPVTITTNGASVALVYGPEGKHYEIKSLTDNIGLQWSR